MLGRFAWYRRRVGGYWECRVIDPDPSTGWDRLSPLRVWQQRDACSGDPRVEVCEDYRTAT
jgi:hypothetical protein